MSTPATRNYVRHAGDVDPDILARREAAKEARRAELDARQAALRESDPELAAWAERTANRRR